MWWCCTWIAIVTNTVLWFLLAEHFLKIISGIILLLKLKWHTFFPYMLQYSLYFRSDDSSLHYCFCISIALIGSFGDVTGYMELANAVSNNIQICPLPSLLSSFLFPSLPPIPPSSLLCFPWFPLLTFLSPRWFLSPCLYRTTAFQGVSWRVLLTLLLKCDSFSLAMSYLRGKSSWLFMLV